MGAAVMNKVDIYVIDGSGELRPFIELRLKSTPVVGRAPLVSQLPCVLQWHALSPVADRLLVWPARESQSLFELIQL